jgi:hypothetical protein
MNYLVYILYFFMFIYTPYAYDINQLNIGVWLSGASYCHKTKYNTMIIGYPANGFIYNETLHDIVTDVQGYIGIIPNMKSIYVVIRGSDSIRNWIDDFEIIQMPYITYQECNCSVHTGFYKSALSIRNKTIDTVKKLQKQFPLYSVVLTGHSYGASVIQLLGMELEKENIRVKIYNYGQPRIGDQKYADFLNKIITEYWRTTHNKDIVPHLPPKQILSYNYSHSCTEIFEDENGKINICSSINCEDEMCSDKYKLGETNTNDHEYYLSHRISCEESTI